MRKALCIMMVAAAGSVASADVLWDQSQLDWNANGFYNSISGSPPFGVTAYVVSDVTVPAGGWTINSISMYFAQIESNWEADVTQGRVYVQPKTGGMPTVLPGGSLVPMTATSHFDAGVFQSYYEVTAAGLSINLAAGDYWIGITPAAPGGFFGPELGLSTSGVAGTTSAVYDVGAGAYASLTTDAAIKVQGVPAPAGVAVAGLAGLFAARRRRA